MISQDYGVRGESVLNKSEMGTIDLPSLPCPKCGMRMEWRLYNNPEWARYAKRHQLFCPNCKKMRRGRFYPKSLKNASEI